MLSINLFVILGFTKQDNNKSLNYALTIVSSNHYYTAREPFN